MVFKMAGVCLLIDSYFPGKPESHTDGQGDPVLVGFVIQCRIVRGDAWVGSFKTPRNKRDCTVVQPHAVRCKLLKTHYNCTLYQWR